MLEALRLLCSELPGVRLRRWKGNLMSLRNGHRSRENVLRRARILRRLKTAQLRESLAAKAAETKATTPAKPTK
jgi:hypothetical protein